MQAPLFDADVVSANSPIGSVRHFAELDSTNDQAKQFIRQGTELLLPTLVIADQQSNGRGRGSNTWWSSAGSLTFSVVYDCSAFHEHMSLVALAAAVAVGEAISGCDVDCASELDAQFKWPNDVFLGDKKVAGILIELVTSGTGQFCVIGIGVNLNCDVQQAPESLRDRVTAIAMLRDKTSDPNQFLSCLLTVLDSRLSQLGTDSCTLLEDYSPKLMFGSDSQLTVQLPNGESVRGIFRGVGKDGQLLIDDGEKLVECVSGSVQMDNKS